VLRNGPIVPKDLAVAVMRCLAKAPQDPGLPRKRWQDANGASPRNGSLVRPRPRAGGSGRNAAGAIPSPSCSAPSRGRRPDRVDAVRDRFCLPARVLVAAFVVATAYVTTVDRGLAAGANISRGDWPADSADSVPSARLDEFVRMPRHPQARTDRRRGERLSSDDPEPSDDRSAAAVQPR